MWKGRSFNIAPYIYAVLKIQSLMKLLQTKPIRWIKVNLKTRLFLHQSIDCTVPFCCTRVMGSFSSLSFSFIYYAIFYLLEAPIRNQWNQRNWLLYQRSCIAHWFLDWGIWEFTAWMFLFRASDHALHLRKKTFLWRFGWCSFLFREKIKNNQTNAKSQ